MSKEEITYSGWFEINATPQFIKTLDDSKEWYLPVKTRIGYLLAKCWVNGDVAVPSKFYKDE